MRHVNGLTLSRFLIPGSLCFLMVALIGCPPGSGSSRTLQLSFDGLEPLGADFVYEGWFIIEGSPVSTGRFTLNDSGVPQPSEFMVDPAEADAASVFVLTIEPAVGDDPGPSDTHLLAGAIEEGEAVLTIVHPAALGNDFSSASGSFILQTPSTEAIAEDYDQGIWWLNPSGPVASLELPELPAGWIFEGWVVGMEGPISTGRFAAVDMPDEDGAGEASGPDMAPPFPGQDFIDPPMVLTGLMAVITIEPQPDDSPEPFALKPLIDMDIEDVGAGVLQDMTNAADNAPTGTATINM